MIADSLKALLTKKTMEKITVSDITELAGIIRPTFYNHFSDKYEILEYILWQDLLLPCKPLLMNDMITEAVTLLFSNIKRDFDFYSNAIRIEGQNSFESIAQKEVASMLLEIINESDVKPNFRYQWLTSEMIAEYFAHSMVYAAITWIRRQYTISPKELAEIYNYITQHSMLDILRSGFED